jgi:hypothetical protein
VKPLVLLAVKLSRAPPTLHSPRPQTLFGKPVRRRHVPDKRKGVDLMGEKSNRNLSARRFLVGFIVGGLIFSGVGFAIRGQHMSDLGTILVGFGVAFVLAVAWVLIGLLMQGVTRRGKGE